MFPDPRLLRVLFVAAMFAAVANLVIRLAIHPDTAHFYYYGFDP